MIKIINLKDSIFWPAIITGVNSNNEKITLECYDPIYMNQVEKDDVVFIKGKEYVDINDKKRFVILTPWSDKAQILKRINKSLFTKDKYDKNK